MYEETFSIYRYIDNDVRDIGASTLGCANNEYDPDELTKCCIKTVISSSEEFNACLMSLIVSSSGLW